MRKLTLALACMIGTVSFAQQKDKAQFEDGFNEYYHNDILKSFEEKKKEETSQKFKLDASKIDAPKSVEEFKTTWCESPESQGNAGTCWCFSTTSFFESEIYRTTKKEIALSEVYTVYWEYVEKAREYVRTRGRSHFGEGSETNAVMRMMKKYGAVPLSSFKGKEKKQKHHNHEGMFEEMHKHLKSVKKAAAWNEEAVISTIKSILNHHIGTPPGKVTYEGKEMSPQDFLANVCKLNTDDYIDFMSLMEKPFYKKGEYDVPDNWWNSEEYYNVELDDFMKVINNAVEKGYSISIGGDVSGAGYLPKEDIAIVPTFDIPHEYIDDAARQLRFTNGSTTDDHAIHLVGYVDKDNGRWYLIKDSSSSARNGKHKGYYFYHESYVKLKMMTFTIHKDAAKDILKKFK
ncbi:MAG: peptidase C1 [Aureispira sp.]|nr:peptidase C1 [Aureispira sp.]